MDADGGKPTAAWSQARTSALSAPPVAASASEPINSECTDHHSLALAATRQIKV